MKMHLKVFATFNEMIKYIVGSLLNVFYLHIALK